MYCHEVSNRRFDPLDDRNICPLWQTDVGDEFHFLLSCPAFESQRKLYVSPYFFERPNSIKFKQIFSMKSKIKLRKLSRFIQYILYVFRPDGA